MENLRKKKIVALFGIFVLVMIIAGIFAISNYDRYKGLISIKNANTKLLGDVSIPTKGTDEVDYEVKYTLDTIENVSKRDVVIKGELNSNYARFKEINKTNVTSEISNNGKSILVTIKDVPLGEEQSINLKINILNAPNNEEIKPVIEVKEATGEYKRLSTDSILVETNSIEGSVYDENTLKVGNIELSLYKDNTEVKRTYTNTEGNFVFSDLEAGEYVVKIEEDIYELASDSRTSESNTNLILFVKEADKFNIETHKYISNIKLNVNGKEENYSYEDVDKVVRSVKRLKNLSGEIEYKIVLKNNSDKPTRIKDVLDQLQEGLSFDKNKNPGWEKQDDIIKFLPLEDVILEGFEKREVKIILDIVNTNEARTYINKLTTKGEVYERVVFILNGQEIRNIGVTEGNKVSKPVLDEDIIWYTDRNKTNEYNFDNEVTKDLILYGKVNEGPLNTFTVTYMDGDSVFYTEEVKEGKTAKTPENPTKDGYAFVCWKYEDECFNFNNSIVRDIELVSSYELENYSITYNLNGGTLSDINPNGYTYEDDDIILNNPSKEGYTFIGWTGTGLTDKTLTVTIPKNSVGNREYTANYSINRSTLTINPNGGEYNNSSSIVVIEEDYGTVKHIADSSKRGYTFKRYNHSDGGIYSDGTYTFTNENGSLLAIYDINNYSVTYGGLTPDEVATLNNPTTFTVETNTITLNNPSNRVDENGYPSEDFLGWDDGNGNISTNVTIEKGSIDDKIYTAVWKENGDDYSITYNLNGGTLSNTNPNSYTRGTATFTLNNPSKEGYTFTGWTGTNLDNPVVNVTIQKGSVGNRNYTAHYQTIDYSITYRGLTNEELNLLNNPTTFTIESDTITLNNPSTRLDNNGYPLEDFLGWDDGTGNIMPTVIINTGNIGDKSYTAIWKVNEDAYSITYNLNGGYLEQGKTNPNGYNRETDAFTLNNPIREGYTFTGWTGTDLTGETLVVTVPKGSVGNRSYTANYSINQSTLTIDPNGGKYEDVPSPRIFTEDYGTVKVISLSNKRGYTFVRYNHTGGGIFNDNTYTFNDDDGTLTAVYEINNYSINYSGLTNDELTSLNNPTTFTVESDTFTLNNPSSRLDENGYPTEDFVGWDDGTGNTLTTVTIENGSIDDKTYTAIWKENDNEYSITYNLNGGTLSESNPNAYKRQTNTFTLNNPSKEGYTFTGWSGTDITGLSTEVTITKGSAGNRSYTANYQTIDYSISYSGLTPEEFASLNNPITYNIESTTFTLNNPETRKDSEGHNTEDFLGWDDGSGNVSTNVTIETGITGNKTYTAIWKENEDDYSITYNLNGGLLSGTNPNTYKRGTATFTLNNPSKTGYTFTGWSGTDITGLSTEVTITKGSSGNRSYTANYQTIDYSISYSGLTNDELSSLNNPTTYNIESNTITLNNPSNRVDNNGYPTEDFLGWDDGSGNVSTSVSIETGTTGDKTYIAIWKENEDDYSITYVLNGGTLSESNPLTYKRQTNTFTLNNPSKTGYTFIGWSGTDITGLSTEVTITKGSVGNRTYTANYQTIDYSISYSGLTNDELSSLNNPTTYNIESNTITLNNPSVRLDQNNEPIEEFVGWDDGSGNVTPIVTINTGSTGNKTYTAIWRNVIIDYSITYNLDGGIVSTANPTTYNRETETFTLNNPTKEGYTFIGWSGTGIEGMSISVTIPKGSSGNRSYIANYNQGLYTISYAGLTNEELDLLSNPTQYNEETETFTLNNPSREGYVFKGWSGTDIDFKSYTVTFDYQDGRTSTTDTYRETSTPNGWLVNNIHYDDNAVITLSEDIIITRDYLAGAQSITLPTPTRQDFVFVNWNSEPDGTGIIYDNNSINNLDSNTTVYAIWRPDKVTITFSTDGTSVNNKIIEYDTEIGELPNSYKPGYLLEGWYFEPELQNKVLSTDKITSNITLYANWVADTFPYVYPKHEEDFVCTGSNYIDTGVSLYTDTDDIYLKDYEVGFTIESYTSTGQVQQAVFFNAKWENSSAKWPGLVFRRESSNNNLEITQTINKGTKKSATFTDWTLPYKVKIYRINHIVYYSINDGERIELQNINNLNQFFDVNAYFCAGDDGAGGSQRYLKGTISNYYIRMGTFSENETHTLQNPDGTLETYLTTSEIEADNNYNFGGNNSESSNTGNNNGNNDPGNTNSGGDNNDPNQNTQNNNNNSNITSVIVTDADGVVTIHDVGEEYNLGANTTPDTNKVLNVTVPKGSSGNRLYVANFERNRYTVTYMNGEDKFYEEQIYHEFKAHGTLDIPTRAHSVFTGWYLNDNLFDFENTPITDNITLTSGFEEVEAPTISYTPTGWTNSSVEVTLSSNHDDYTYMYKIGDGDYMPYTNQFTVQENTTVYAYSIKDGITSLETVKVVDNIDKNSPVINSMDFNDVIPTSAYLDLRMIDEQSGLDRFKVYVDNVLVYESTPYGYDSTDEIIDAYLIEDLTRLSTYIVKVEVFDVVGNMSTMQKTLETPLGHAVARTLNYQGEEIEQYTSLYEAITSDACTSSCHIQMLDDVTERNIIDQNQNILLDLNGKTITGSTTYAFTNDGTLTIVDYNENDIGQVLSGGNAIINNGILQVGELEDELVVSTTEPVIGGSAHGIDNYGLFKFYDGILMGTQAVHGIIDETPYLYNANIIDQQDSIQIARLDKVVDAVARINSMYYTEVQTAIDRSKNGYSEENTYTSPLLETLVSSGKYHFRYDEDSGTIVNCNQDIEYSAAYGYIKLDLTNYTSDPMLTINVDVSSPSTSTNAYIKINESTNYNDSYNTFIGVRGSVTAKDYRVILEKGKVYYLHFKYDTDHPSSLDYSNTFRINSVTLAAPEYTEFSNIENVVMYSGDQYYFEKQAEGSYVNNNIGVTQSTAHSYFVVDMTNVNEDKEINIRAKISSYNGSTNNQLTDYGYIVVDESPDLPSRNNSQVEMKGIKEETNNYITLKKNKINYVHICYKKQNSADQSNEDKFTITSIGSVEPMTIDTSNYELLNYSEDNYYFVRQQDGSIVNNNTNRNSTTAHSYMLFDLTDAPFDAKLTLTATVDSEEYDYGEILLYNTSSSTRIASMAGSRTNTYTANLLKGQKNYLHFYYSKDSSVSTGTDTFKISNMSINTRVIDTTVPMSSIDYITNLTHDNTWTQADPILNEEPDTVQLLKNITLTRPLEVVDTRNVILDLNGKTLTTSANNYVIDNKGNLKIIDTEYEDRLNINKDYKIEQARLFEEAKTQYLADNAEYEEYVGLCENCEPSAEYIFDQSYISTFDYTGQEEEYQVIIDGNYKIEAWGAEGGTATSNSNAKAPGGYGGYSYGEIELTEGETLYINVGGRGEDVSSGKIYTSKGGYNGGGNGYTSRTSSGTAGSSGGGATSVATKTGLLSELSGDINSIIIVAGGGGGSHSDTDNNGYSSSGGHGGGASGHYAMQIDGTCSSSCTRYNYPSGGTQTTGGLGVTNWSSGTTSSTSYVGTFGQGATGTNPYGGGGGGFYGGASGAYNGGGGGSGYIGNESLSNKKMTMYSTDESFISTEPSTKTEITTNVSENPISGYAKKNNGYVKITRVLTDEEIEEITSQFPKTYNIKEKPRFKDYITGIDFNSLIDIDSIDVNSDVDYNNIVDDSVHGNIYSSTNSVILNEQGALLNIETGNVTLDATGTWTNRYGGIINKGNLTLGDNAYIYVNKDYGSGIYNIETGDILDGSGNIINTSNNEYSEIRGIWNISRVDTNIKGYNIINSYVGIAFYNESPIDLTIENITMSGAGSGFFQLTNTDLTVNNSTLKNKVYALATASDYYGSIYHFGKVTINNCNITSTIDNASSNKEFVVKNSNISLNADDGNKVIISNSGGDFTVLNSNIIGNNNSNASIVNSSGAKLSIIDSSISGRGIKNNSGGILNITGDTEITADYNTNAINNYGILTVGNNENAISDSYPTISGATTAVYDYIDSTHNFYDGKLIGLPNNALIGGVSDVPADSDLNVINTEANEIITLKTYNDMISNEDYVAEIGSSKFVSIQAAIDSINNPSDITNINILKDIYTARNTIIPTEYNVSINQKNHFIKSYNPTSCFTNNGTLEVKDDSNSVDQQNVMMSKFIVNNGTATYRNINTASGLSGTIILNNGDATLNIASGFIKTVPDTIINFGNLNISGGEFLPGSNSGVKTIINNKNTGNTIITGGTITNAGGNQIVYNEGNLEINDVTIIIQGNTLSTVVSNTADGYTKITGGSYGQNGRKAKLIQNLGTADLIGVNSNFSAIAQNTGVLTITNGTYNTSAGIPIREGDYTPLLSNGSGTLNLIGTTINDTSDHTAYIGGTSTANIENSTLSTTGSGYGIFAAGTATVNVKSGAISSNRYALFMEGNETVNIGVKGGIPSKTNPSLTGGTYGLYNSSTNSTVNFYDGIISGPTSINGAIREIEPEYEVITLVQDGIEHKYLDQLPVARNKRTTIEYNTIQEAITAADSGDTIELIREYTTVASTSGIVIPAGKTIVFDLLGNDINQNNEELFTNNGTLTIKSTGSAGTVYANDGVAFINNGILNITEGSYNHFSDSNMLLNNENATVNISGGRFASNKRLINNYGNLNISDGYFYKRVDGGATFEIYNFSTGNLLWTNGEVLNGYVGSMIINEGTAEISDGLFNLGFKGSCSICTAGPTTLLENKTTGYARITGGTYGVSYKSGVLIKNAGTAEIINVDSNLSRIAYNTGDLIITNGTFNMSTVLTVEESGTLTMTGSVINSNTDSGSTISIEDSAVATMNNVTINTTGNQKSLSVINSATVNFVSGTINNTKNYGAYLANSATLNIGTLDGTPSVTNPSITGKSYGLYNSSTNAKVNFYDGVLIGNTAVYGAITDMEPNYEIISETVDGKEHKYLDIAPVVEIRRTHETYDTIQDGIDMAQDGDELELIRNYTSTPTSPTITVPIGKSITLDLMNYKINQNNENLFTINGTLTVQSTGGNALIESNLDNTFTNNGTLNILSGNYLNVNKKKILTNNEYGTMNISGGIFTGNETIIYNDGIMNISGGRFVHRTAANTFCIANKTTGSLFMTGGEILNGGYDETIINEGNLEITDTTVDLEEADGCSMCYGTPTIFIENKATGHAVVTGGTYGATKKKGKFIVNYGTAEISDIVDPFRSSSNNGTLTLSNVTLSSILYNGSYEYNGIINMTGDINTTSTDHIIEMKSNSTLNVISGTIKSDSTYPILVDGENVTINIGTPGGIPSTTDPVIQGKGYAILAGNDSTRKIYFYDGVIIGETAPVSGVITDYEPGYKEDKNSVTDPDSGITTIQSTLTLIGDDIKTVMVNNINFISLQSAVNYAVNNNISDLQLYNNITLDDDLIKPDGIDVNIHLNGFTINQTVYTIDPGIHLVNGNSNSGNNLGASIFNNNVHTENIVIYELDDGSKLSTTNTYKLYDSNDNIVKVNENRIGNYDIGNDREELNTVNGKIYINNITEGTYKLISSDNKEINFEITSDGVSSNIRVNNKVIINRVVEAIATVIITIQTGTTRLPFILFIAVIMIVISSLIVIKKHKRI